MVVSQKLTTFALLNLKRNIMALFLFIEAIIVMATSHTPEEWEDILNNIDE